MLLIIVRGYCWLKVDCLTAGGGTSGDNCSALSHDGPLPLDQCSLAQVLKPFSPRFTVLCKFHLVSVHLNCVLVHILGVLLAEPLARSVGQDGPLVWNDEVELRPDLLPTLHGLLESPTEHHSRTANRARIRHTARETHQCKLVMFHACDLRCPS